MNAVHRCGCVVLRAGIVLVSLSLTVQAQASLVGDTILRVSQPQLTGVVGDPTFAIVQDPGVEYIEEIIGTPLLNVDVGPDYIRLNSLSSWNSPWFDSGFDPSYYEFRDLDWVGDPDAFIGGVEVDFSRTITPEDFAPMDYPDFSAANVTFNADTVRLSFGGYQFPEGSFVHIQLIKVPAPTTLGVMACGVLACARRRQR